MVCQPFCHRDLVFQLGEIAQNVALLEIQFVYHLVNIFPTDDGLQCFIHMTIEYHMSIKLVEL